MSSNEQALSLLGQLAMCFDGAVLGVALAYVAVRSVLKYTSTSSALRKLSKAPSVRVSDLRTILNVDNSETPNDSQSSDGKLVIVRGTVEAKSAIEANWKSLRPNVLVSQESGDRAVVIQRTQTVYILCLVARKLWIELEFLAL